MDIFVSRDSRNWSGGANYIELLAEALTHAQTNDLRFRIVESVGLLHRLGLRPILQLPWPSFRSTGPKVNWLPDCQELVMPEMFSQQEILKRRSRMLNRINEGNFFYFSSKNEESLAKKHFPNLKSLGVIRFSPNPTGIVHQEYPFVDDFCSTCRQQGYFYLPNQWWRHKNHLTVVNAFQKYKQLGGDKHLILTGVNEDPRWPKYSSSVSKSIQGNSAIHNLHFVPKQNQMNLYQFSSAVLQPSLYEGWSTSVEEAMVFARPIIASNLDSIVEQDEHYGGVYFCDPTNEDDFCKAMIDLNSKKRISIYQKDSLVRWKRFVNDLQDVLTQTQKLFRL